MSFSSISKNELALIRSESKCCNRAQLSGIVRVSGTLSLGLSQSFNLRITTENPAVARLVFIFLKKLYKLHSALTMKENKNLNKNHSYDIAVENANHVLLDLGLLVFQDNTYHLNNDLPYDLIEKGCCKKAYLRGIYMGGGSLTSPEKSYHLELITHHEDYANACVAFINSTFDLAAKTTMRKKNHIVYIKESEKIVDFLNIIGAHQTLLDYENVRIIKQMRNNVNRVVNCETANLTKTIDAAYTQVNAIKLIEAVGGLNGLPDKLREMALLRLENPEATLVELGELADPPIGKSGVNHRLKKIIEISETLQNRKG